MDININKKLQNGEVAWETNVVVITSHAITEICRILYSGLISMGENFEVFADFALSSKS